MKEKPYPEILDRHMVHVHLQEHFGGTFELAREIVDYGSNLIPRSFVSSDRHIHDIVIIGALLQHAVTMLDAVEILVSQGAVYAAFVQARSLFETRLYISWILQKDTVRRAHQYFVWHRRDELLWAKRAIPGTPEHTKFRKACAGLLTNPNVEKDVQEAATQVEEITRILADVDFREINAEFDRLKKPDKDHDVHWYQPWGPNSLSDMASRLGLSGEYVVFYTLFSKATHCSGFRRHVNIEKNGLYFQPIRHPEGISTVLNISLSYAIDIYRMVLERYRSDELPAFSRKYQKEWQSRFRNIPTEKYNVTRSGNAV
jgi:hypothetical protein